ncbi:MAG: glutamine amidotransferase [Chthonomonadales bacterium]
MPLRFNAPVPVLLGLAVLVPAALLFAWWCHRHSLTDLAAPRKRVAFVLRCLLIIVTAMAAAQTRWFTRREGFVAVFAVDVSRSIRPAAREKAREVLKEALQAQRPGDTAGIVTFASHAHVAALPSHAPPLPDLSSEDNADATNIAEALDAAASVVPPTSAGKIVLVSDGNENVSSALSRVPELAARHIPVDTVLLPSDLHREALIDRVVAPARVKIGEPFTIRVFTLALNAQPAVLSLRRVDQPGGAERRVQIPPGRGVFAFEAKAQKPGFYRFEALMQTDPGMDTILRNNRGEAFVHVSGTPAVLYVAKDPAAVTYLKKALAPYHVDLRYVPPAALPATPASFQQFDSIILSGVARADLSDGQMAALQEATRDLGVGFLMIGGEESFGAGGYRNTPVEEMLPVSLEIKKQKRMPSVAVALVIEDLEIPTSVNMSKEAAKAMVDLLDPIDEVGVLDCVGFGAGGSGTGGRWRIPLQHVTDRAAIQRSIDLLDNMGDPPNYDPFLLEAARVLQQSQAKVKHIVFLGDGDAMWEASTYGITATLQRIRNMGITVSTVASGADNQGIAFMAAIARDGGGSAYVADRPEELPRILLKDQQTYSAPPIIEEPFFPRRVPGDELVANLPAMPPLLGYNVTTPKPTARVSLVSHRNDPILAAWRYGLGRTVAFTSDDRNRWAARWLGWQGFAPFWAEVIRWTMRSLPSSDYQPRVTLEGSRAHITVDAVDRSGRFVNGLVLKARVVGPSPNGAAPADLAVRQTSPGRYEAWFDAQEPGAYVVNVMREQPGSPPQSSVVAMVTPYPLEYRDVRSNPYLMTQLASLTGGAVLTRPADAFRSNRPASYRTADLVPFLLGLALFLLPLDVAVRRLNLRREDLERARVWLGARLRRRAHGQPPIPSLERLQTAKRRTQRPVLPQEEMRPILPTEGARGPGQGMREDEGASSPSASPQGSSAVDASMERLMDAKRRARDSARRTGKRP